MDHWISEMTKKKQGRLVTGCTGNMQQLQDMVTQDVIFDKFDKDQTNNLKEIFYRNDSETGWKY